MTKSRIAGLCAAAFCISLALSAAPASAQNRMKTCNDEWNAMKANNTVGDKKYADFRKECLARTAAQPAAPTAAAPETPAPVETKPAMKPAMKPAAAPTTAPTAAGEPVFPTAVSSKYASEKEGAARRKTCLDQYHENQANNGNGGLKWIEKGGGYYSECNKHLKGA